MQLLCCTAEFCREVTDIHMPVVAPVILPEMLKIFTQHDVCLLHSRYLMYICNEEYTMYCQNFHCNLIIISMQTLSFRSEYHRK